MKKIMTCKSCGCGIEKVDEMLFHVNFSKCFKCADKREVKILSENKIIRK